MSKSIRTSFSDSPRYFDASEVEEIEKNVVAHSDATAFARSVLPVPGGPKSSTPVQPGWISTALLQRFTPPGLRTAHFEARLWPGPGSFMIELQNAPSFIFDHRQL